MKVAVAGASGFVGSSLARVLLDGGTAHHAEVNFLDSSSTQSLIHLYRHCDGNGVPRLRGPRRVSVALAA